MNEHSCNSGWSWSHCFQLWRSSTSILWSKLEASSWNDACLDCWLHCTSFCAALPLFHAPALVGPQSQTSSNLAALTVGLSWHPQLWFRVNYMAGEAQVQSAQHLQDSDSPDHSVQQLPGDVCYLVLCQGAPLQNNREISCSGLICWINGGYWTFTEY